MWAAGSLTPAAGGLQVARAVSTSSPAAVGDPELGVVSAPSPAVAETKEWWAVWWSVRNVKNPGLSGRKLLQEAAQSCQCIIQNREEWLISYE